MDRWGHKGTGGRVGGADMWAGGTGGQVWGQGDVQVGRQGTGGETGDRWGDRGQVGRQGTGGGTGGQMEWFTQIRNKNY